VSWMNQRARVEARLRAATWGQQRRHERITFRRADRTSGRALACSSHDEGDTERATNQPLYQLSYAGAIVRQCPIPRKTTHTTTTDSTQTRYHRGQERLRTDLAAAVSALDLLSESQRVGLD